MRIYEIFRTLAKYSKTVFVLHFRSLQLTERSPSRFAVQQSSQANQHPSHRTVVRLSPNDEYQKQQSRSSPSRHRHRSPIDYGDYSGEDPYNKSRSFDEDYGAKKNSRNYGRRLYEHNLINVPSDPNRNTRSPLLMDFRPEAGMNKRIVPVRLEPDDQEQEELNENEQFYHLKKLLSNANLQNSKNYQYTKSRSAAHKRNQLQSSESLVVSESPQQQHSDHMRSPMLSKRAESLQAPSSSSSSQSPSAIRARATLKAERGTMLNCKPSGPPPQLSSGRY